MGVSLKSSWQLVAVADDICTATTSTSWFCFVAFYTPFATSDAASTYTFLCSSHNSQVDDGVEKRDGNIRRYEVLLHVRVPWGAAYRAIEGREYSSKHGRGQGLKPTEITGVKA